MTAKPGRIPCLVPFCRRSTSLERLKKGNPFADETWEWLCSDHWRLVSRFIKRRRAQIRRLLKLQPGRQQAVLSNANGNMDDLKKQCRQWQKLLDLDDYYWERAKQEAMGL